LPRIFFPDQPAIPPPPPGPPGPGPGVRPGPGAAPDPAPAPGSTAGPGPAAAPGPGSAPPYLTGSWQQPGQAGQPGLPGQPAGRPAPERRSRPTARPRQELRHRAVAATIFGLLSLLALSAANQAGHASYLVAFALAVGVAACVLGITAARRARREDTALPRGSITGIVLGTVSIGLALLAIVAMVFTQQLTSYEQCMHSAATTPAQQSCTRQLLRAVQTHYGDSNRNG
jgi:hypothetical protein